MSRVRTFDPVLLESPDIERIRHELNEVDSWFKRVRGYKN